MPEKCEMWLHLTRLGSILTWSPQTWLVKEYTWDVSENVGPQQSAVVVDA